MAASFTSWADLYLKLLDDLASGSGVGEYTYTSGGVVRRVVYRSFSELKERLEFVGIMKSEELGTVVGRTYAYQGTTR